MKGLLLAGFLSSLSIGSFASGPDNCRLVFDRLVASMGNTGIPKPVLQIVPNNYLIAKTFPSGEVKVGLKFVTNCRLFGRDSLNALAHVLSHELVHYYRKHFWAQGYGSAFADSDWGKKIAEDEGNRAFMELYETQADQLGMLYAVNAGFNTMGVAPRLLDSLYVWFHPSTPDLPGYPPLAERKKTAELSIQFISSLLPAFELAQMLQTTACLYSGDMQAYLLDFSGYAYEHILASDIRTPEMLNNIALVHILKSNRYNPSVAATLKLPLVLDGKSILYEISGTKGDLTGSGNDRGPEKLAAETKAALENLNEALKMDELYWPAAVNKAVLFLKTGKFGSFDDLLSETTLSYAVGKKLFPEWYIAELTAVRNFLKEDKAEAKKKFSEAAKKGSPTAMDNLSLLEGKVKSPEYRSSEWNPDTSEIWDGRFVGFSLRDFSMDTDQMLVFHNRSGHILKQEYKGYILYELTPKIGFCPFKKVKFALAAHETQSTSKGIGKGSSLGDIKAKYGVPDYSERGTAYLFSGYLRHRIIFRLNPETGKVIDWIYFSVK
jgi:hypothetical protein